MPQYFDSNASRYSSYQQQHNNWSDFNHPTNNGPNGAISISQQLRQIQNAIGGMQTAKIMQGQNNQLQEMDTLDAIHHLQSNILNGEVTATDAKDILTTATQLLNLSESENAQKALIDTISMTIDKNTQGVVNLDFLSQFAATITATNDADQLIHSPSNQLQIINTAQAAFNGIWKANHTEQQKPLTDAQCEKYAAVIPRMEKVLYGINNTRDLQLHSAILKLSLGAFKTTTAHVAIPPSKAGKALKNSINEYIYTVGAVMALHQKEWKKAAKEDSKLKTGTAQFAKSAAGATSFLPKSLMALGGGIGGGVVGTLGLLRLPFALLAGIGLDINPLTNPEKGFPATKHLVAHTLSSPFRHAANGVTGGWEVVDHKNLAFQAYDAICNAGQSSDAKQQRESAQQLEQLSSSNVFNAS
ncbi:MAG: hypothetical protein VX185_00930 [Pseudomonadota bacterium]|nr:hypothetical protein [Pseudomonadota bacterium]